MPNVIALACESLAFWVVRINFWSIVVPEQARLGRVVASPSAHVAVRLSASGMTVRFEVLLPASGRMRAWYKDFETRGLTIDACTLQIASLPVWRRRRGGWEELKRIWIVGLSTDHTWNVAYGMLDELLEKGCIQVAEISLPRLYGENSDMLEAVEVDATIALGPSKDEDFNDDEVVDQEMQIQVCGPATAFEMLQDDRAPEVIEPTPAEVRPCDATEWPADVGPCDTIVVPLPSVDDDVLLTGRWAAQAIGTRQEFELQGVGMLSRYYEDGRTFYVAVTFTGFIMETCRVTGCDGHISIAKGTMEKDIADAATHRAKTVVDAALRKLARLGSRAGVRPFQGSAQYNHEYAADDYAFADLLVHTRLHVFCFAVLHALNPRWKRPNFHLSFRNSRGRVDVTQTASVASCSEPAGL